MAHSSRPTLELYAARFNRAFSRSLLGTVVRLWIGVPAFVISEAHATTVDGGAPHRGDGYGAEFGGVFLPRFLDNRIHFAQECTADHRATDSLPRNERHSLVRGRAGLGVRLYK